MRNFDYCAYTYRHRKALVYTINKIIKDENVKNIMLEKAKIHDMDKMVLYLFIEKSVASDYHRRTASHHVNSEAEKTYYDYLEAVLDYECAGYTKPDKPYNVFDIINIFHDSGRFDDKITEKLLNITKELGINYSYSVTEDVEGMNYMKQFEEVTEEMILAEVLEYVDTNRNNVFHFWNSNKI